MPLGPVVVVGVGADGWAGLSNATREAIESAQVVVGAPRQLALLPASADQLRRSWPRPLLPGLPALFQELQGRSVTVLASGDPLLFGIGGTLVTLLGAAGVRVLPAVSSVTLAGARMGWPADSFDVVTVVGRDPASALRLLSPGRRLVVLSADESSPALLAERLTLAGYGPSALTVLSDLGSATEARIDAVAAGFPEVEVARLNLVCVQCSPAGSTMLLPAIGGLPDYAFEHDGQITKRDARASALARLAPVPGQLMWDVGAGAGSVAIEWARTDPRCSAIAVERDPSRAKRIARNASNLGVPSISVLTGVAPELLGGLPAPDAVFVGGGASTPGVLETCWRALPVGGRIVVHAVTLQTERLLIDWHTQVGGELIRLSVERVEPIGSFTGWAPARSVVQWSTVKVAPGAAVVDLGGR